MDQFKLIIIKHPKDSPLLLTPLVSSFIQLDKKKLKIAPQHGNKAKEIEALLMTTSRGQIKLAGEIGVVKFLARCNKDSKLIPDDAMEQTEMEYWLERGLSASREDLLKELEEHLKTRTFVAGTFDPSLADLAVWVSLSAGTPPDKKSVPAVFRWFSFLSSFPALSSSGASGSSKSGGKASSKASHKVAGGKIPAPDGSKSTYSALENAVEGKVCTRFPPEPSGFMHLGHLKAALLNSTYAEHYKGKLLVRFDDTNPTNEKEEYTDAILEDLQTLGIKTGPVSFTSDHFELIMAKAEQLIKQGDAYMDDTPAEEIKKLRWNRQASTARDNSIETNLKMWEQLKSGTPPGNTYVLRAKIDPFASNACLRDPNLFRSVCNTPHARTGDKYKAYPLYDLACPIVDSHEGVTHALRSNEYHDRNPLYYWVLDKLNMRRVYIQDFSRLNFKYTVLSKRKLQWFVDNKLVEGWSDPSFPTIKGLLNRGLTKEAMYKFIFSQGGSHSSVMMDTDKLWAFNKQIIDPIVPRHTVVKKEGSCLLTIQGVNEKEVLDIPSHPKNKSLGTRKMFTHSVVRIEGADAATLSPNEEITLMHWGNVIVTEITKDASGCVTACTGRLNLGGDFKKTKKLNWLADLPEGQVQVNLITLDNLITKECLEDTDTIESVCNRNFRQCASVVGDTNLLALKKGDMMQLERRGYWICHIPSSDPAVPVTLVNIPDGKTSHAQSILDTK